MALMFSLVFKKNNTDKSLCYFSQSDKESNQPSVMDNHKH